MLAFWNLGNCSLPHTYQFKQQSCKGVSVISLDSFIISRGNCYECVCRITMRDYCFITCAFLLWPSKIFFFPPLRNPGKFMMLYFSEYFCFRWVKWKLICVDVITHLKPYLKHSIPREVGVYTHLHECWGSDFSGALYFPLTEACKWKWWINFCKRWFKWL